MAYSTLGRDQIPGHVVFVLRLLPQPREAANSFGSPRVINVLAAGKESTDLFLDDLTLKEPSQFDIPNFAVHAATSVTLTLKRIAEALENKDIMFIHPHPGVVSTDLFMKSWARKFDPSKATAPPAGDFMKLTPDEAGERCIYLATSAEFGGNGVPVQNGRHTAKTLTHGARASLFSINDKFEIVEQDDILADIQKMGTPHKIWDHTFEVIHSLTESD
ncbi:hypothetical protein J7337_000094 [Fusarium musae]|uniref:Uncharacterized protein n=1 Tax=Fusarium musae TaxID=1042133 RepID=A0A9P8DR51_9HYPO|nr:hypothetical protein J7337_000094 [Fusarium musae]KAG9506561.1 hypothetical protein J7337_000094 [Fusarium musae]